MSAPSHATEIRGGLVLLLAAVAALVFVNAGGADPYREVLEYSLRLGVGALSLEKSLHHWINDGLMVLFFLLVGIEINREIRMGSLRDPVRAAVPILSALGGFIAPAVVFLALVLVIAGGDPALAKGWSVPTATDIAFAVAVASALRDHIPASLRIFLLALAVVDDLLAIIVIALFYTADLVWMNLFLAGVGVVMLLIKNRLKVQALWFYLVVGFLMWLCVLKSGVHATVAGVMIGLLLPLEGKNGMPAPADTVEQALQGFVRWLVLPLFAFANVGVDLRGMTAASILNPLTLSIAAGLIAGKQFGIFGTVWVLERAFGMSRPPGASWRQVYGVACLCGIGFTMSLFVGALALPEEAQGAVRIGVLSGSLISALLGIVVLRGSQR